jgi:hypothetical protein
VLRAAFGHSHREIAEILELDEAHARQLYHRAHQHVGAARRRFTATPEQRRKLLERFLAATVDGDVSALERLLAEDVAAKRTGATVTLVNERDRCISLGRRDGLIHYVNPDDSPREKVLTGRLAALVKEAIVRGAAYAPRRPALIEAATLLAV